MVHPVVTEFYSLLEFGIVGLRVQLRGLLIYWVEIVA